MLIAATILDRTRGMATALVDRAERESGSRMLAYERVATAVGVSASWLRKFVRGYADAKGPDLIAGLNIFAQYDALCLQIETAAELEKTRAKKLWGNIGDAATGGFGEMVQALAKQEAGGKDT